MHLVQYSTPARSDVDRPTADAVRDQLERLRTKAFGGSGKLFAFLRFVVEEALDGRAATLKELVIGIELYGGVASYDPRIDSSVRVEARRLRRKLDTYYAGAGVNDTVIVSIPTGSYAPCLRLRSGEECTVVDLPLARPRPILAVLPFTALGPEQTAFATGITDELIYAAECASTVRVAPRSIVFQFRETRFSLDDVAAHTGSDLVLHGTIREAKGVRRVSVELCSRSGQILWSDRIDDPGEAGFGSEERIALEIMARLPADALRTCSAVGTI